MAVTCSKHMYSATGQIEILLNKKEIEIKKMFSAVLTKSKKCSVLTVVQYIYRGF